MTASEDRRKLPRGIGRLLPCRGRFFSDDRNIEDVAAQVLNEVDAVAIWKSQSCSRKKAQVVASVMEYLTDRVYGCPTQTVQGNPEQPVTIQLPVGHHAGMADIGYREISW